VPGGIKRPWEYRCSEIGSYQQAQHLLRQGHTYLESNGDREAFESRP
jgi:hypothetical protein